MDSGPSRGSERMTRRQLREKESDGRVRSERYDQDGVRFTTFDFVRRGILDPIDGPMRPLLDIVEARERALREVHMRNAAENALSVWVTPHYRKRPSDGVRPYIEFHLGQASAIALEAYRGKAVMSRESVARDRLIVAQRAALIDPSLETASAVMVAEHDLRLAIALS